MQVSQLKLQRGAGALSRICVLAYRTARQGASIRRPYAVIYILDNPLGVPSVCFAYYVVLHFLRGADVYRVSRVHERDEIRSETGRCSRGLMRFVSGLRRTYSQPGQFENGKWEGLGLPCEDPDCLR